ncbi:T9SS type A sorting domain-containing protein [Chryseobacterium tructae]|uniref:T9SS type A sorting domain-containing protein n=1 Tax=Chryseobacterium tructae TaxID=1037380 RepID=A0ABV7Y157_9FLAO|nr:T9SS type A sorting domain-containing protein [Chryseobacterium tructae]MDN3694537.1 T9SS type A sorting domain-containing protein [Chryseobacterium tructae]
MIKNLLLPCILMIQSVSAQIISYDNSFASNGKYTIAGSNTSYNTKIVQNPDKSFYFTYAKDNSSSNIAECVISKLNANGTVDSSFGNNGETIISNYYTAVDSQLTRQSDGKLLVFGFNTDGSVITRITSNGQLDPTFGSNGSSKISNIFTDFNGAGYGLYLQNNKIIIYGLSTDGTSNFYKSIYRLNNDGSIDNTFGYNGSVKTMGNFIFLDNQSNIVSFITDYSNTNSNVTYPNGGMEKYNSNGQPLTTFGNNGALVFTNSPGVTGTAFMDSNNYIVCANVLNNEIFRMTPNGIRDNTFVFDNTAAPFNDGNLSSSITEKNGSYYISWITGTSGETFLISKLTSTGAIDPLFNYYSENAVGSLFIGNMIVNDGNIFATRGNQILKFLLNSNATLATADFSKASKTAISFENPIKQDLIYHTKETIQSIEIYSSTGKLAKTVKNNHSDLSALPSGVYMLKIRFTNGKETTKKLIKK